MIGLVLFVVFHKKLFWPLLGFLRLFFILQPLIEATKPLYVKPCILEQTLINKRWRPTLRKLQSFLYIKSIMLLRHLQEHCETIQINFIQINKIKLVVFFPHFIPNHGAAPGSSASNLLEIRWLIKCQNQIREVGN